MSKLVRFVNHSLKDFFVSNAEDSCDSSNQFLMVNIAPSALFFLKNVLIADINVLTLCIGIGFETLLVWYLEDAHFLQYAQEILCLFCTLIYSAN